MRTIHPPPVPNSQSFHTPIDKGGVLTDGVCRQGIALFASMVSGREERSFRSRLTTQVSVFGVGEKGRLCWRDAR